MLYNLIVAKKRETEFFKRGLGIMNLSKRKRRTRNKSICYHNYHIIEALSIVMGDTFQ